MFAQDCVLGPPSRFGLERVIKRSLQSWSESQMSGKQTENANEGEGMAGELKGGEGRSTPSLKDDQHLRPSILKIYLG